MKKLKSVLCMLAVFLMASPSFAHDHDPDPCSIDIKHGVEVNKAKMRVFDKDKTLFEIDNEGKLWIEGKFVALNSKQQKLTKAYFQKVQTEVPQLIEMTTCIVKQTSEILHRSFGEAFGKDSGMTKSIDNLMTTVQNSIALSMSKKGDEYRIAADGDKAFQRAFGDKFEKEVEAVVEHALGSILIMVAKSLVSEDGDFEERMEAIGEKIEKSLGSDMENIEKEIEISAKRVCREMATLSQLETQMRREIPLLASYVVFD